MNEFTMKTFEAPLGRIAAYEERKRLYEKFIKHSIYDMGVKVASLDKKDSRFALVFKVPYSDNYKYNKKGYYDVIIECVPPVNNIEENMNFAMLNAVREPAEKRTVLDPDSMEGYSFRLFSNAPSFIYNYTFVYKQRGCLINWIPQIKYSRLALTKYPEKTNPSMVIYYETSIWNAYFFAKRFKLFNKSVLKNMVEKGLNEKNIINNITSQEDKLVEREKWADNRTLKKEEIEKNKLKTETLVRKFLINEKSNKNRLTDLPVKEKIPFFSGYFLTDK